MAESPTDNRIAELEAELAALRVAEQLYRSIVVSSHDPVFILSTDGQFRFINPAAEKLTGYTCAEASRMSFLPICPASQLKAVQKAFAEALAGCRTELTVTIQAKDGRPIQLFVADGPVLENDRITGVYGVAKDLTSQQQTQESLQKSQEQYRLLAENSADFVTLHDAADNHCLYRSPSFYRVTGWREEDLDPQTAYSRVHPDDLPAVKRAQEASDRGETVIFENRYRCKDGRWIWLETRRQPVFGPDGKPSYVIASRDITERKQSEEKFRRHLAIDQLVAEVSVLLFNAYPGELDAIINDALGRLGTLLQVDRAYLFSVSEDLVVADNTHEWCVAGVRSQIDEQRNIPTATFRWFLEQLGTGNPLLINRLADIPAEAVAERQHMELGQTQAAIFVPVRLAGKLKGFIGCDSVRTERQWSQEDIHLLGQLGAIFFDVQARAATQTALWTSETRYRRLYESMIDAYVAVDMSGRIIEFNPSYEAMLGYTAEELRRLSYVDITPERWHSFEAEIIADQILSRGYSKVYEKEYRRKDGTIFPVELRTFLIRDDNGQPASMWAIVRDITKRRQAEAALRDSEAKYRALIETTNTGYVIIDVEGRVQDANQEYVRLTGHRHLDEIRGHKVTEWTARHDLKRNAEAVQKCSDDGFIRNLEMDYVNADGRITPVEINATVLKNSHSPVILGIVRDITERKEAMRQLAASERRFRALIERGAGSITVVDATGKVTFEAEIATTVTGFSSAEMVGKSILDLLEPEDRERAEKTLRRVIQTPDSPVTGDFRIRTKDGSVLTLQVTATNRLNDPAINGIILNTFDITERKQAAAALYASQQQLQLALNASQAGIWYWDATTNATTWDGWNHELYGFGPHDPATYEAWISRIHPEDRPRIQAQVEKFLQPNAGSVWNEEFRVLHPVKGERWMLGLGHISRDSHGHALQITGINLDVTDRKVAELALQKSEARLATLFNTVMVGIVIHGSDGHILHCNPTAQALLGLTEREALGKGLTDSAWQFYRADGTTMPEEEYPVSLVLAHHDPLLNYIVGVHRGHSKKFGWVLVNALPQFAPDGSIAEVFVTFMDITDQKEAQAALQRLTANLEQQVEERTIALRESEQRYRSLLEGAPVCVAVVVGDKLAFVNRECTAFLGARKPEEIIGRPHKEFQHPADRELTDERLRTVIQAHKPVPLREKRMLRLDGGVRHVYASMVPITYEGQPAALSVFRDVTELRRLEREIAEISHRERARIGRDLHDSVCQQLTGIAFFSKTLETACQKLAPSLADQAGKITRLIQQALTETRGLAQGLAPIDLQDRDLAVALQELAHRTTEVFTVDCTAVTTKAGHLPTGEQALHFYRIAQEAISNAIRHGQAKRIRLELKRTSQNLMLTVRDNGTGLPATATEGKSTGMGLPIMQYRADNMGGHLTIRRASPNRGTILTCAIPLSSFLPATVKSKRTATSSSPRPRKRKPTSS